MNKHWLYAVSIIALLGAGKGGVCDETKLRMSQLWIASDVGVVIEVGKGKTLVVDQANGGDDYTTHRLMGNDLLLEPQQSS